MPKLNGDLCESDALRLLRTLRFLKSQVDSEITGIVVCSAKICTRASETQELFFADNVIRGEEIQITVGDIVNKVLNEYKDYE